MAVNKVILVGNLGQDPELRSFPNGGQVCNIRLATTEKWNDRQSGEKREHTEWHTVIFNDRLADIANQFLRKGSQVYVEGSLRTRKWQDRDGNDRYTTEVRATNMQMLGGRTGAGAPEGEGAPPAAARPAASAPAARQPAAASAPSSASSSSGFEDMDDDIPF